MTRIVIISFLFLFSESLSAATVKCMQCSSEVDSSDNFCQFCGKDMSIIFKFDVRSDFMANAKSGVTTPLKISIMTSFGVPWDDCCTVAGLDTAVLVSRNYSVYGVGVSGISCYIRESSGLVLSGGGCVSESSSGIMIAGLLNMSKEACGIQIASLGNQSEAIYGVQIGLVNRTNRLRGVQLGFMNSAGNDVSGVQIGCLNEMGVKDDKLTLPLVNMRF